MCAVRLKLILRLVDLKRAKNSRQHCLCSHKYVNISMIRVNISIQISVERSFETTKSNTSAPQRCLSLGKIGSCNKKRDTRLVQLRQAELLLCVTCLRATHARVSRCKTRVLLPGPDQWDYWNAKAMYDGFSSREA